MVIDHQIFGLSECSDSSSTGTFDAFLTFGGKSSAFDTTPSTFGTACTRHRCLENTLWYHRRVENAFRYHRRIENSCWQRRRIEIPCGNINALKIRSGAIDALTKSWTFRKMKKRKSRSVCQSGVAGLHGINMGRSVSVGILGPEEHGHSLVVSIGAFLLSQG